MTPTLMKNNCSLHWIDARGMENGVSLDAVFHEVREIFVRRGEGRGAGSSAFKNQTDY